MTAGDPDDYIVDPHRPYDSGGRELTEHDDEPSDRYDDDDTKEWWETY